MKTKDKTKRDGSAADARLATSLEGIAKEIRVGMATYDLTIAQLARLAKVHPITVSTLRRTGRAGIVPLLKVLDALGQRMTIGGGNG